MTENRAALQELYRELDFTGTGTRNLAWYGQQRALGYSHEEALARTKEAFGARLRPQVTR